MSVCSERVPSSEWASEILSVAQLSLNGLVEGECSEGGADVIIVGRERDSHSSTEALKGGKVGYCRRGAVRELLEGRLEEGLGESAIFARGRGSGHRPAVKGKPK